jgi:hypothetical protein
VYPVVAGVGWEGGFHTYEVAMPQGETETGEASEEAEEEALVDEFTVGRISMTFGAPYPVSATEVPEELRASRTGNETKRAYAFNPCFFDYLAANGDYIRPPTVPPLSRSEINHFCHGFERGDQQVVVRWAAVIHGWVYYRTGEWVWINRSPDCDEWGKYRPVEKGCYADARKSRTRINIFGQYRFYGWDEYTEYFQPACMETNGTLGTRPPRQEYGGSVIRENYHRYVKALPPDEPCPWHNLSDHDVRP